MKSPEPHSGCCCCSSRYWGRHSDVNIPLCRVVPENVQKKLARDAKLLKDLT